MQNTLFDNPIHNHLWCTIYVVKTTLVRQLPTLRAMFAFTLYRDGVFSFLNSSGTFWNWNIVHYLLQQYLTTFFSSPQKLLCVDYCCFHNEPFNLVKTWKIIVEVLGKIWWNPDNNFQKTLRKIWWSFENSKVKFWEKFGEVLKTVRWNFERKLMRFWKEFSEILRTEW